MSQRKYKLLHKSCYEKIVSSFNIGKWTGTHFKLPWFKLCEIITIMLLTEKYKIKWWSLLSVSTVVGITILSLPKIGRILIGSFILRIPKSLNKEDYEKKIFFHYVYYLSKTFENNFLSFLTSNWHNEQHTINNGEGYNFVHGRQKDLIVIDVGFRILLVLAAGVVEIVWTISNLHSFCISFPTSGISLQFSFSDLERKILSVCYIQCQLYLSGKPNYSKTIFM